MTAPTISKINAAIAKHGVEVVRGRGYFYFSDLSDDADNARHIRSVFSDILGCMTLEQWIAHVDDALSAVSA